MFVLKCLANRQGRICSRVPDPALPPTFSAVHFPKKDYQPQLKVLAFGPTLNSERSWGPRGEDEPHIDMITYTPRNGRRKFDISIKKISIIEFMRHFPNSCIFGEARGPWAWIGEPFPAQRSMGESYAFV
ncbi:hypothetical protein TWF694_011673 [Orbilia ellipsospora]|uniref:Uncharacterized protein n=1 Tax=Orbilia ellipsospora TaxID=2528407 RepID=A0AAV9X5Y2_9PEZI